jgi:ATP-binding cassette subfamily B multidrug efflux pump
LTAQASSSFHEDLILGKAFDRRLMGRLLRYALPYRAQMALAVALILAVTALGLVGPFLIMQAIDGPLRDVILAPESSHATSEAYRGLYLFTAAFLVVSVALVLLRFVEAIVMARIGQRVMLDLRHELFSHLVRMPFAFYDRNPVGRLVTRMTSDVEALNELFASGIVSFIADVLVLAGITLMLVLVNPSLALVTMGVVPLLLLTTFVFRAYARRFYREQRGHLSHLNAFTQESVQGMSLIQVFNREAANQKQFEEVNRRYLGAFLRSVLAYSVYFPVVEILGTVALAAVIWQGGLQITSEPPTLTFGQFFLFWYYLGRFFQPIRDMAERYNVLQAAMAAAERVFKVLDTPETLRDPSAPRRLERLEGRISFENVWFAYKDEEYVLKDVSFTVEPGEMAAIVGATGSGKSTIINLISRFYEPQRGTIRVDGIDVRAYKKSDLRRHISVVLQDVFLFSRTVRENIALGRGDLSLEKIVECARRVHADGFISRLPHGYEEVLKERGRTLSVGEKQLLAFARALAHDPGLLVLDEATANIDSGTEALIQDALQTLLAGRTSIVIAHRLSTIRRANRIIVIHKGELRETGTHAELMEKRGIYCRLHELEYGRGAERSSTGAGAAAE